MVHFIIFFRCKNRFSEIKSLGISTQRASFITWQKDTGKYLHNFITWKDLRALKLIKEINSSWLTTVVRWIAYSAYLISRNRKYGMGSKLRFASNHVSIRLLWVLTNIPGVKEALEKDNLLFGTLDTWLIYKLTGGKLHVTDISNASATGFFDPFDLDWGIVAKLLKIPLNILPKVVDNDYNFGVTREEFLEFPLQ
ncbi:hypothetical protein NQ317_011073 [Molorchus minor]|uniref:Carbohydrate kinase FGGY N-terminal domain-containing protein n=1 Tax=Molorchus minor TaxID=1323400 RepID=A0ABQ9J3R6_9CUCU|nr:hypothetical protein NQ317_011073 [Molorchus minor]